jgi:hypothetical protein
MLCGRLAADECTDHTGAEMVRTQLHDFCGTSDHSESVVIFVRVTPPGSLLRKSSGRPHSFIQPLAILTESLPLDFDADAQLLAHVGRGLRRELHGRL